MAPVLAYRYIFVQDKPFYWIWQPPKYSNEHFAVSNWTSCRNLALQACASNLAAKGTNQCIYLRYYYNLAAGH